MTKTELRGLFKIRAKDFFLRHDAAQLAAIHRRIAQSLSAYCTREFSAHERTNATIAVYQPLRAELPVTDIIRASAAFMNPTFVYPQVDGDAMWFCDEAERKFNADFVIVPGLFVDRAGNRLGRGKGYYDRFLREAQTPLKRRIFLGYDFQFVDAIPTDERDELVTIIGAG